jgi:tetratricopeptide (TPR) repeat protein
MPRNRLHFVGKGLFLRLIVVSPWVYTSMSDSAFGMMAKAAAIQGSQSQIGVNEPRKQGEKPHPNDRILTGGRHSVDKDDSNIAGGKGSTNKSTLHQVVNESKIDSGKVISLIEEARKARDSGDVLESLRILGLAKKIVEASSEEEFIKKFISVPINMSEYNSLMTIGRYKDAQVAIEGVIRWIETPEVARLIREDSRFLGTSPYSAYYKAARVAKYIEARRASEYLDKGFNLFESDANKSQPISESIYKDYAQLYEQLGHYNKAIAVYSMMGYLFMGAKGYKESPRYADLLNRLANLYMILGNNGYAELLVQGAIRIYTKYHKTHLRELQWSQLNLFKLRGKFEEAVAIARGIEDKAYQANSKAEVLNALGAQIQFADQMNDGNMLQQLFHRFGGLSKSLIDEGAKEDPGSLLLISIPLSERLLASGKIQEAKDVITLALDSASKELGPENFLTIKALLTLALVEERLDEKKAINMYWKLATLSYDKSLTIQTIDSLSRLSYLEAKGGDFQAAILAGRAHSAVFIKFLHDTLPGLVMKDRVRLVANYSSDILHTLSASHPKAVEAGLWAAINERGLLDHIELSQRKAARDKRQRIISSRLEDLASLESSGRAPHGVDLKDEARKGLQKMLEPRVVAVPCLIMLYQGCGHHLHMPVPRGLLSHLSSRRSYSRKKKQLKQT